MHSLESALIAATMHNDHYQDVFQSITEDHFSTPYAKAAFCSALEIFNTHGALPEITAVRSQMVLNGMPSVDANEYLIDCIDSMCTSSVLPIIAQAHDAHKRRVAKEAARKVLSDNESTGDDLLSILSSAAEHAPEAMTLYSAKECLRDAMKDMEERATNPGTLQGLSTGIHSLDDRLSGMPVGSIILAARPSIGKTALALNICETVAIINKIPTAFFSLEMGRKELMNRMALTLARVDYAVAKSGRFSHADYGKLQEVSEKIASAPLWFAEAHGHTMQSIRARAKAAKRKLGIGFLVIDYLGLVSGQGSEYERVTEASMAVKRLSLELNIPVLCLHQLKRPAEAKGDKRPTMSELRSSGQIEQDADVILLIHRKKEYEEEEAEIIIEKHRNGPTGIVRTKWIGPHNRFMEA